MAADEPSSSGVPFGPLCQSTFANLSCAFDANTLSVSRCSVDKMLIPITSGLNDEGYVDDVFSTQAKIRGRCKATEQYALAARPRGFSSFSCAVITVPPVTNWFLKSLSPSRVSALSGD